jgi:hypothetical protein
MFSLWKAEREREKVRNQEKEQKGVSFHELGVLDLGFSYDS